MKIAASWSTNSDSVQAAEEAYYALIEKLAEKPRIILVHGSCLYDCKTLLRRLTKLAPDVPIQGGISCLGVMTEQGFHSNNAFGLGLLGVADPEGDYGAGISDIGNDPKKAARIALEDALAQAGRSGEAPAAILVGNAPGHEELIIQAIEAHVGSDVPIISGTSADNDMSGQ